MLNSWRNTNLQRAAIEQLKSFSKAKSQYLAKLWSYTLTKLLTEKDFTFQGEKT